MTTAGEVEEPPAETLICFRDGLPIDERLTSIDETLIPPRAASSSLKNRRPGLSDLRTILREEVFRYYPARAEPLRAEWGRGVDRAG
jgi:hypothetical protein